MKESRGIEVLARGVCVRRGRVLLCHTRGARNTYLPGGHVEFGESARESLRREIREELGCRASVGRFLGVVEHRFRQKRAYHCEINLVFEARLSGVSVSDRPRSRESHLDFRWWPLSRMGESKMEPSVLRGLLRAWLDRRGGGTGWACGGRMGR